ncbi:MAG: ATP-dependent helicase, partial [Rhodospirillales bacterium]
MPWYEGLDPGSPAYGIAASEEARIRVVAGPGTGKSFALKRRVAKLLEEGIHPDLILPDTFTRVAAEDLHRELVGLDVDGAERLQGKTLHSLGLSILRRQIVLESTGRIPRPLNQYEIEPLLYDLTNSFGNKTERKKRIRAYEAAWARLQHEEPGFAQNQDDAAFEAALVSWLIFHEAMLIGEIVPELYRYLRDNPASPERSLYEHILVDEFQDLNKAEQKVVEYLGGENLLCIVGDDDQSIYSFKHANPEGIRDWHEVHEEAEDHVLLECRRCPTQVVRIANSLIAHNRDRLSRQLTEMEENGPGRVHIFQFDTLEDEVTGISATITNLVNNEGVPPGDILVLAQRKVIGNPIYESLQ